MLNIVRLRFIKIADRHLREAEAWSRAGEEYRDSLAALRYANKMVRAHLDMAKYWQAACDTLHYKPGTWAYRF